MPSRIPLRVRDDPMTIRVRLSKSLGGGKGDVGIMSRQLILFLVSCLIDGIWKYKEDWILNNVLVLFLRKYIVYQYPQ